MRWVTRNRRDVATFTTVALAVLAGLVGNILAAHWSWAIAAALIVLTTGLGGLEILRRRMDDTEGKREQNDIGELDRLSVTAFTAVRRHLATRGRSGGNDPTDPLAGILTSRLRSEVAWGDQAIRDMISNPNSASAQRRMMEGLSELLVNDAEILEHVRKRASSPGINISASGSTIKMKNTAFAGGNVDQSRTTRIGTGGLGVVVLAALLGSGTIGAGKLLHDASSPPGTRSPQADGSPPVRPPMSSRPSPTVRSYRSNTVVVSASDLDPRGTSEGLDDLGYHSSKGLSLLNNARVSMAPEGQRLSKSVCEKSIDQSPLKAIATGDLEVGGTLCVRTSDDHIGTISITNATSNALGGFLAIGWTIWY